MDNNNPRFICPVHNCEYVVLENQKVFIKFQDFNPTIYPDCLVPVVNVPSVNSPAVISSNISVSDNLSKSNLLNDKQLTEADGYISNRHHLVRN